MSSKFARNHFRSSLTLAVVLLFCAGATRFALEPIDPPPPVPKPVPEKADKNKPEKKERDKNGPEHNVTLLEEPGANDLFNRAKKNRALAEKDPEKWPDCVKNYSEIL